MTSEEIHTLEGFWVLPYYIWYTLWQTCLHSILHSRYRVPWVWRTWYQLDYDKYNKQSIFHATVLSCTPSFSCLLIEIEIRVPIYKLKHELKPCWNCLRFRAKSVWILVVILEEFCHLGSGGKNQMASEIFKNSLRNSNVNLDIFRYQIK